MSFERFSFGSNVNESKLLCQIKFHTIAISVSLFEIFSASAGTSAENRIKLVHETVTLTILK